MSEQPVTVSADDLATAGRQTEAWQDAIQRAQHGETVAVIAHGEHVADGVPSGELARLRETIDVLSDHDLVRALADREPVVQSGDAIRAIITQRVTHERP